MITDLDKANARLAGIGDFNGGKHFGECPYQGFQPDDIELRWQWQKGWLRGQLEKKDKEHPPSHKV